MVSEFENAIHAAGLLLDWKKSQWTPIHCAQKLRADHPCPCLLTGTDGSNECNYVRLNLSVCHLTEELQGRLPFAAFFDFAAASPSLSQTFLFLILKVIRLAQGALNFFGGLYWCNGAVMWVQNSQECMFFFFGGDGD